MAHVCHSLATCQRHMPSSLAAVIGLSNNDVISLRSLRSLRHMRRMRSIDFLRRSKGFKLFLANQSLPNSVGERRRDRTVAQFFTLHITVSIMHQ